MRRDYFTFAGVSSLDYGVWFTEPRTEDTPEREVTVYSVPGRSGDLISDGERWKNTEVKYGVAIIKDFLKNYRNLKIALLSKSGYQRLEDSIREDEYRMAMIREPFEPETAPYHRAGRFDIIFDCKPQRYLKSGETAVAFTAAGTLSNPHGFPALPLITVYGSGAGTVSVGGVTVTIKDMTDTLILDCENMNAYNDDGNQNLNVNAPEFPVLKAGDNGIAFTGGVTKIEITPRWWVL